MADATGSQNLLGSIIGDAFQFATPFAQKLLGQTSTPQQVQKQTLADATLNGSGPNDPTLAKQAPLGLWDYITGGKVTGQSTAQPGGGGLTGGTNTTFIALAAIVVVAIFVIIKK